MADPVTQTVAQRRRQNAVSNNPPMFKPVVRLVAANAPGHQQSLSRRRDTESLHPNRDKDRAITVTVQPRLNKAISCWTFSSNWCDSVSAGGAIGAGCATPNRSHSAKTSASPPASFYNNRVSFGVS